MFRAKRTRKLHLVDAGWDDTKVVQPDGCGQARRGWEGRILPPGRGNASDQAEQMFYGRGPIERSHRHHDRQRSGAPQFRPPSLAASSLVVLAVALSSSVTNRSHLSAIAAPGRASVHRRASNRRYADPTCGLVRPILTIKDFTHCR